MCVDAAEAHGPPGCPRASRCRLLAAPGHSQPPGAIHACSWGAADFLPAAARTRLSCLARSISVTKHHHNKVLGSASHLEQSIHSGHTYQSLQGLLCFPLFPPKYLPAEHLLMFTLWLSAWISGRPQPQRGLRDERPPLCWKRWIGGRDGAGNGSDQERATSSAMF